MNYASWSKRVGASLIDTMVVLPFLLSADVVHALSAKGNGTAISGGEALPVALNLIGVTVFVYNNWYLAGKTGQSWGKKALGITLVGANSQRPIGFGRAILRSFAHFFDMLTLYIGYLMPLWDKKRQTIADKLLKSTVVVG